MSESAIEHETTPALRSQSGDIEEAKEVFALAQRQAKALSQADFMPKEFQGDKGIPNCMVVLQLSHMTGMDAMQIAQSLDVVHGKPRFRSKFLIACVNSPKSRFNPLEFEFDGEGDAMSCVAFTTTKDGKPVRGPRVSIQMAKDEGWYGRAGSKWKTTPELMLYYRAASFFVSVHCPEMTMGMSGYDEEGARGARAAESRESAAAALRGTITVEPEYDPETGEEIPASVGR